MSDIRLSIVVPAYHEADRIEDSLRKLSNAMPTYFKPSEVEVVVVCADSPDNTGKVAAKCAGLFKHFKLVEPGARVGKGRDVRSGILAGSGEFRMFMDADLATPLKHLANIAEFMERNGQVGVGVRDLAVSHTGIRKFISEFGNILVRILLTPGISDSQCGFKVFRADAAKVLFAKQRILSWGFDMEILAIARVHKYKIDTFVIKDWHDPKEEGLVGDSSIKVALQTGVDLLRILKNRVLGRYK